MNQRRPVSVQWPSTNHSETCWTTGAQILNINTYFSKISSSLSSERLSLGYSVAVMLSCVHVRTSCASHLRICWLTCPSFVKPWFCNCLPRFRNPRVNVFPNHAASYLNHFWTQQDDLNRTCSTHIQYLPIIHWSQYIFLPCYPLKIIRYYHK